jgi:hypothetical protein
MTNALRLPLLVHHNEKGLFQAIRKRHRVLSPAGGACVLALPLSLWCLLKSWQTGSRSGKNEGKRASLAGVRAFQWGEELGGSHLRVLFITGQKGDKPKCAVYRKHHPIRKHLC